MLIVNADDWGRTRTETDAALSCFKQGRITSASAMVFMEDSIRAADVAKDAAIDVGLHLNLTQRFAGQMPASSLWERHDRIARFLTSSKYAGVIYNPALRSDFRYVYQAQVDEFVRLYGKRPSHIDGHHHQHLCTNMLLGGVIARGERVRRSFSFWPGEKSLANRTYRRWVDAILLRRYRVADYFFGLVQCVRSERMARVSALARQANVEIMAHPVDATEYAYLMGDDFLADLGGLERGTYALI